MEFLEKLNRWVYQVEKAIVVVSLLVMSVVVFLAVVHRRYADPESLLANKVAGWIGIERETETWQSMQDVAGPISLLLLAAIIYLGFRSASRRKLWNRGDETGKSAAEIHGEPLSHLRCLIYTVVTIAVSWLLIVLLFGTGDIEQYECIELKLAGQWSFDCGKYPAGPVWAQPLGLVLTLWVAYIGASMATRDNLHLKVDAVQHALSDRLRHISGLISGILTAGFCVLLAYLAWRYVGIKYEEWEISNGLGGLHNALPIPFFVSFAIVPVAFLLMALRFLGLGVLAFRGQLDHTPAELRELESRAVEGESEVVA